MEVSFYPTRREEGKQTSIFAHVRYSGHQFKHYLDLKIDPALWNLKDQRAKKTNRNPGYAEFNRHLDKIADRIRDLYNIYRNNHQGHDPSPAHFKDLIGKDLAGKIYQETKTFVGFFEELRDASLSGARVQPKTGKAFIPGTLKAYTTAINHLKEFELTRRRKLSFDDITVEFHADFTEFLIRHHQLTANSIGKDIKNVKMVMNEAWERGLHKNLQYKSRRFTVSRENVDSIYLSARELDDLMNFDLSARPKLEQVRDLFVIGCHCGLRFGDLASLKPEHIQDGFIKITQAKTGDEVVIPVHPVIKTIMEKYGGRLPRALSNQKTNDRLKQIGQKIPSLSVNVTKTGTKGGMKVTETLQKWELLCSHTQRRTFATLEFLAGTATETIMACTGHRTQAAFMKYLRLTPTEHAQKMKDIWATRNNLKAI